MDTRIDGTSMPKDFPQRQGIVVKQEKTGTSCQKEVGRIEERNVQKRKCCIASGRQGAWPLMLITLLSKI